MAMVTSMISGPLIRRILRTEKKRRLQDILSAKLFLREISATSRREVIQEMTAMACAAANLDASAVEAAVWNREEALSTGLGNGVALPHARIDGLRESLVVVGVSEQGIDFDAPDGKLANVIFLILTPVSDPGAQLEIASEIAGFFRNPQMSERVLQANSFTDFLALLRAPVSRRVLG